MSSDLPDITKFLHDETKNKLVIYELEFNKIDDPNEKLHAHAKSQGQCACRLWLILFLVNFAIIAIVMLLLLLLLIEIGPVRVFWLWCVNMSFIKTDPRHVLSCGIFYCILIGSTTLSNLYLASISIDRSIMILCPIRYRSIVTRPHAICRIILICLVITLVLIPHYFYLHYDAKAILFLCNFTSLNNRQRIHFISLIHTILFVSIPSLIVCISSIILLNNRRQHKRKHKRTLSLNARRMHKRSVLIFLLSLWFFLSLLPAFIVEIFVLYDRFFYDDIRCSIRLKIYKILYNCFLIFSSINYSTKFYIRLIVSTSFRESFIQFICCQNHKKSSGLIKMNNKNKNKHRLLPLLNQNKANVIEI
ncbi:unnamed protein product [Rotaria sp. Silwood1]|nr:unnamed protein product [Rotaria sp. Silwood1]